MSTPLNNEHMNMFLSTHHVGRLGLQAEGKIYVVPVTYVFENGTVYFHTNPGMKADFLRANPEVCFEVDDVAGFESWQSVIAWGRAESLDGAEAAQALDLMFQRLGGDGPDAFERSIRLSPVRGATFKVPIREMTGRYNA